MNEPVRFGSYELLDRIAEGGMAEVWRARSRGVAGFEKTVVIKRVLPSLMSNPGFAELLVREAKIAALLNHPNIVQIFDLGEQDGAYFIAMEYLEGRDLGAAMSFKASKGSEAQGLSLPLRLWIVSEAAKALDYAHRRKGEDGRALNIVHRDVSPQNVLLGYEGAVKVADFGIARADDQGLGRGEDPKVLRGKYAYMSPEQASGEHLDRRSDLFSLGVVLWEVVANKRLFRAGTTRETLERVRAAQLPAFDPAAAGAPPGIVAVLERALARDREDRYPSAGAMHADLSEILFGLGAKVGEADLASSMAAMFPPQEEGTPNKLRVDLMMRAYDDATGASLGEVVENTVVTTQSGTGEHTQAFPVSRRLRSEQRPVAVLVSVERPGERAAFEAAAESAGGFPMPPLDGVREAVFGHATGAERAAEHAARAALELRRALLVEGLERLDRVPPMALVRGEATVFEAGVVEPTEETHARAVRLVKEAPPGVVRVEPELRGELSRAFRVSDAKDAVLEGFRARADRDALALRARIPIAGRRAELLRLSEALAAASELRASPVILVVGEVGSGKSRVLAELRAVAAAQDVTFVRGRGDPASRERSYSAFADLFRDICGVDDEDGPGQRFEKVGRLRVLGLSPRQVRIVGELLGLNYPVARDERSGRPRGLELALAARRALRTLARERALVLVLEDLHWMDDPSRQLLPILVRGLTGARLLTVMTARGGVHLPVSEAEVLPLLPLDVVASARLFAAAAGARAVDDDATARIVAETAGNPALIEDMVASLRRAGALEVDEGVAHVDPAVETPVTDWLHAHVSGRLAELRPEDRDLARAAASFAGPADAKTLAATRGMPRELADLGLRRLCLAGMVVDADAEQPVEVVSRSVPPGVGSWGGGGDGSRAPRSVHVPSGLVRRGVLDLMGESERRRLHGSIAAVLEREGAGSDAARIEELAHHAARSPDRRRAPDYLVRAADAADGRSDPAATARHLAEAVGILREDAAEDEAERILALSLRAAEAALDANAAHLAHRVLMDLGGRRAALADDITRVRVAIAHARTAAARGAWEDARSALEHVTESLGRVHDPQVLGRAHVEIGRSELELGRPERAVAAFAAAVKATRERAPAVLHGRALVGHATALAWNGDPEGADELVSAALALTARSGEPELRHLSLAAMGRVEEARGKLGPAASRLREAAEVAEQEGAFETAAGLAAEAASLFAEIGEDGDAAPLVDAAARLAQRTRAGGLLALAQAIRAALDTGDETAAPALPVLVRSVDRLLELRRPALATRALVMLARANLLLGDRGAASRTLHRASATARDAGQPALSARLARRAADVEPAP